MSKESEYVFDEQDCFRKLVKRSKDIGNGWRQVSEILWPHVKEQVALQPATFEVDEANRRIRFATYG